MNNPQIDTHGTKRWTNSTGQWHREDGPAIDYPSGSKLWYQNGNRHRLVGPAIEWANGTRSYYINGQKLTEADWNEHPLRKDYIIKENLKSILND